MVSSVTLRQMPLFADVGDDTLDFLGCNVLTRRVKAGETIFRAGDEADGMYVIGFGAVHVLVGDAAGRERFRRLLGRHEVFGEMALFTNAPRSASIVAATETELYLITRAAFLELLERHPAVATGLLEVVARRLQQTNENVAASHLFRIVICHSALGDDDAAALAAGLAAALSAEMRAPVALLDLGGTMRHSGDAPAPGVELVPLTPESAEGDGLPQRVSMLRQSHAFVIMASSRRSDLRAMVRRATGLADLVLLGLDSASLSGAVADLSDLFDSGALGARPIELVTRDAVRDRRGLSGPVRARLGLPLRWHIPPDERMAERLAGLARHLAGTSIGLALGGGGARGFAHIGVLDEIERAGIPIDLIGGTSFGALMASTHAVGWDAATTRKRVHENIVLRKPLNDYTLPYSSILRGRKTEQIMRDFYEGLLIEDLEVPFFSVSADLISGGEVVIDEGLLWRAVMPSLSIPGVFPPVRRDGKLLVDGMLLNNVPVDVLKRKGIHLALAVNVSTLRGDYFDYTRARRHGWLGRLLRRSRRIAEFLDSPSLMRVILQSEQVSSHEITKLRLAEADVRIEPRVNDCDLFEFRQLDLLIDRGREAAAARIDDIRRGREGLRARQREAVAPATLSNRAGVKAGAGSE